LYGTSVSTIKEAIDNEEILILAIDVKGALQVIDKMPEAISIFINAPDDETLKLRLKNRLTDDDAVIDKRFIVAKEEMEYSKYYDYCVINDRLDDAVKEIEGILNLS
jgi:guanylate kinase